MPALGTGKCQQWLHEVALRAETDKCVLWPFKLHHGYGRIGRGKSHENQPAHRYVCLVAHGPPRTPNLDAAHSCGRRACVNWRHVRWATRAENEEDKKLHGRANVGARHGMSKLTAEQVLLIRKDKRKQFVIANEYGVTRPLISLIKSRKAWGHLKERA